MKKEKDIKLVQLGQRIREIRAQKGMTQTELAKLSEVSGNYIAMLERGERNATYLTLLRVASGLNVEPRELF